MSKMTGCKYCGSLLLLLLLLGITPLTLAAKSLKVGVASGNSQQRKTVPSGKAVPVPDDWVVMEDKKKGYSFEVPKGTQYSSERSDNIDFFMATPPEPIAVSVLVMAFKDPKLTKEDLLKVAGGALEGFGGKNVKFGKLTELSDDYSLATYTAVNAEGGTVRGKVLVATDVTDNYVMLVGAEDADFKANEKIIDEIWGSFSMRSGGASGKS